MARDYMLNTFLRQTPNHVLKEYFGQRGLLAEVDFDALAPREYEPIRDAIEHLGEDERAKLETDFQDIFQLADSAGTQISVEMLEMAGIDEVDQIQSMENHYHRAMWLFLNHNGGGSDLFETCVTLAQIKEMSFRQSRTRKDLPRKEPAFSPEVLQDMGKALSGFYRRQGRGHKCKVEHYLRKDPVRHYYAAFPEDYSTSELQYDGVDLRRRVRKSVFYVVFVFRPDEGILEISAPGGKKEIQLLQEIFCRYALGLDRMPPRNNDRCYELNRLKYRGFNFPTSVEHAIASVEVVGLRMNEFGCKKRRLTVEQDPQSDEGFYDWLERVVAGSNVSLKMMDVSQAKIRVTWLAPVGKKAPTLTFTVTMPDSCSLKDHPRHLILKEYLKEWEIAK